MIDSKSREQVGLAVAAVLGGCGVAADQLDEVVHGLAERASIPSRKASRVNNEGLNAQVAFLFEHNENPAGTFHVIQQAVDDRGKEALASLVSGFRLICS